MQFLDGKDKWHGISNQVIQECYSLPDTQRLFHLLSNLKDEKLGSKDWKTGICALLVLARTPIKNIAVYYQFRQYKNKASRSRLKKETVMFVSRESRTFRVRWRGVQKESGNSYGWMLNGKSSGMRDTCTWIADEVIFGKKYQKCQMF